MRLTTHRDKMKWQPLLQELNIISSNGDWLLVSLSLTLTVSTETKIVLRMKLQRKILISSVILSSNTHTGKHLFRIIEFPH